MEQIAAHEADLVAHAHSAVGTLEGVRIIGTAPQKVGVVSLIADGIHPYDMGTLLDGQGIAVRTGHHCTEPLMDHFGLESGTLRMSFAAYTTTREIDVAVAGLARALAMLR